VNPGIMGIAEGQRWRLYWFDIAEVVVRGGLGWSDQGFPDDKSFFIREGEALCSSQKYVMEAWHDIVVLAQGEDIEEDSWDDCCKE
jgi:hypothetical protein